MKLLLTGDLHLGRTSTRIPATWAEESRTLAAWERLVDTALTESVHAVLLSGDLLDASNLFWETIGPFEQGIRRLSEAGIDVLAVSGNHDAAVLPAVAKTLADTRFRLLGQGGQWERVTLEEGASTRLHVDGWSFPAEKVFTDPTESYPVQDDGTPVLGMVHGDPGVVDSHYAPLDVNRLGSLPLEGWLLGHIHKPSLSGESPWILMPGSPHPLDPGEPGHHHAWIVEVADGRISQPVPACPALLRYREVDIALAVEEEPSLDGLYEKLQAVVNEEAFTGHQVLRVTFSGETSDIQKLQSLARELEQADISGSWVIDRIRITARPPLDLDTCRTMGPIPALLAEALETPAEPLSQRVSNLLQTLNAQRDYDGKGLPPLIREDVPLKDTVEEILRTVIREVSE